LFSAPPFVSSEGYRVTQLADAAGLHLDDWEAHVLDKGLARAADGMWSAFEKALIVSRQNGKGAIIEALELAALFLDDFDAELILHSAHEFKTAAEGFRRILGRIENNPLFYRRVRQVHLQRGAESIELRNGKRLRFIARSSGSGRGFSADLVILDEAYELGDAQMAALLPTLSARPNPQIWYTSTAGMPTSVQLGRVRDRGVRGGDPSLAFFEWSVDPDDYDPADPADWARANPGLGIRITPEYIERERAALGPDEFARERLGIGNYPVDLSNAWQVISRETWTGLADSRSKPQDPVAFAAEVTQVAPYRRVSAVNAAGYRPDGRIHVELVDHRDGTDWVVPRLAELRQRHHPCATVIDPSGHAGALLEDAAKSGVELVMPFTARDAAQAFGQFRELADAGRLVHLAQPVLDSAVAAAVTRSLGDALAWDRRSAVTDIGPLVGATLAVWALAKFGRRKHPPYNMLRSVG
jgi:phage terminase large subunit-like protein